MARIRGSWRREKRRTGGSSRPKMGRTRGGSRKKKRRASSINRSAAEARVPSHDRGGGRDRVAEGGARRPGAVEVDQRTQVRTRQSVDLRRPDYRLSPLTRCVQADAKHHATVVVLLPLAHLTCLMVTSEMPLSSPPTS